MCSDLFLRRNLLWGAWLADRCHLQRPLQGTDKATRSPGCPQPLTEPSGGTGWGSSCTSWIIEQSLLRDFQASWQRFSQNYATIWGSPFLPSRCRDWHGLKLSSPTAAASPLVLHKHFPQYISRTFNSILIPAPQPTWTDSLGLQEQLPKQCNKTGPPKGPHMIRKPGNRTTQLGSKNHLSKSPHPATQHARCWGRVSTTVTMRETNSTHTTMPARERK